MMNFGLIINAIVASKKNIPFHLLYNRYEMIDGNRIEDISKMSVFAFDVPWESGSFISSENVKWKRQCYLPPSSLIPIRGKI